MADRTPMALSDLLHAAEMQAKHTADLISAVKRLQSGATSQDFPGASGALVALTRICRDYEGGIEALRADAHLLLTGRPAPRGNAPALVYAVKTRLEENDRAAGLKPQNTLRAAMALADDALGARAHACGDAVAATSGAAA